MANTKTDGQGQKTKNTEIAGKNGQDYYMPGMMTAGVMMAGIGVLGAGGLAAGGLAAGGLALGGRHRRQPVRHKAPTPAVHPAPVHAPAPVQHAAGCGKFYFKFFYMLMV